jgi:multidrug efflux pump subunit AcrB
MKAIRWMAKNHVAANLIMILMLAGGVITAMTMKVEIFPEFDLDRVTVSMAYPGAGPKDVEEGIIAPIEEAVYSVEGVKRLLSTASEGSGVVLAEVLEGSDVDLVVQDIKAAVDRIRTFPQLAERPVIQKMIRRRSVLSVVLHGDLDKRTLRDRTEALRDGILALPNVTQADLTGVPIYEISVEIKEETLRRHNLTLNKVAQIIRAGSLDVPAGAIKTRGGEILLRTKERRYTAKEYEDLVVINKPDGTLVRLKEIAKVRDTLEETEEEARFKGQPAAMIEVFRVGDQRPAEVAATVKAFVAEQRKSLPKAVGLDIWFDRSEILQARMDLLKRNAGLGLLLVIVVLGIFLRVRLAFWVTMGIPISILGAMLLLPWFNVSINMMSLFAFILVLGIVVDDAIIVGENAFAHRRMGKPMPQAAADGAVEVTVPVVFAILTTLAAFAPLLFVRGIMGKFMWSMPVIVIAVLLMSLFESLFVLPAHLARTKAVDLDAPKGALGRLHLRFEKRVERFIAGPYRRLIERAIRYRYITLALALVMLIMTVGLFAGGYIKTVFMPRVEGDVVHAKLTMPFGSPATKTKLHVKRIQQLAEQMVEEYDAKMPRGQTILRNIYTVVGGHMSRRSVGSGSPHLGEVAVYLKQSDQRNVSSIGFARRWSEVIGEVPGAESLKFRAELMHMGEDIDVQLSHDDFAVLLAASERVKKALHEYKGLFDIADSYEEGKRELALKLRPEARALGINQAELANQVRGAFYGAEALRMLRGRNELRVMVRYPLSDRRSLADINAMRIRTPAGGEIPFAQAAMIDDGRGFSYIQRTNRRRVIDVTARANREVANPDEIVAELKTGVLPQLQADYPGLTFDLEGQQREHAEGLASLKWGFLVALGVIFGLLAIPFRSYTQPLLVMSAIPFGVIGAVLGHLLMGFDMSLLSMMGVVALTGVVVNDSLVLIDFINRNRKEGMSIYDAVLAGGQRRFRPIVLTTATTFLALVPMLAEPSVQAKFLVPMAVSLAFGVLFATQITLVLIPALYMILEDAKAAWAWLRGKPQALEPPSVAPAPVAQIDSGSPSDT